MSDDIGGVTVATIDPVDSEDLYKRERPPEEIETVVTKVKDSVSFTLGEDRYEIIARKKGKLKIIRTGPKDEVLKAEKKYGKTAAPEDISWVLETPKPKELPKETLDEYVKLIDKSGIAEGRPPLTKEQKEKIARDSEEYRRRVNLPIKEFLATDPAVKLLREPRTTFNPELFEKLEKLRAPLKEIVFRVPRGIELSPQDRRHLQERIEELLKGRPGLGTPVEGQSPYYRL
jgi:hypothetical protein